MPQIALITQQRAQEIMCTAHKHWLGFINTTGRSPKSLFDRTAPINQCALDFFRYCTEVTTGAAGATIVSTTLPKGSGAPSWLWHCGGGVPRVLLDYDVMHTEIPTHAARKLVMRLILHEAGHLILHFSNISAFPVGIVRTSHDAEEQEAWVFAGATLGLALGQAAPNRRPSIVDDAWALPE